MSSGKLSSQRKSILRKELEKMLVEVPEGERIKLERDVLEELIFERVYVKDSVTKYKKVIVWDGAFLRKIDLSEVSFDDVDWDYSKSPKTLNLSGTNIKPDFEKSFARRNHLELEIKNCDFSNAELSDVRLSGICNIRDCNFSYSGIKIDLSQMYMVNVKLNSLNFTSEVVSSDCFERLSDVNVRPKFCCVSFSGTGLHITKGSFVSLSIIQDQLERGLLLGCYLDNEIICSVNDSVFGEMYTVEGVLDEVKKQIKSYKKPTPKSRFFGRK